MTDKGHRRARLVRRALVALSISAGIFAVGAFGYRKLKKLPEVASPSWLGELESEKPRDAPAAELEANLFRVQGVRAIEIESVGARTHARIFADPRAEQDLLTWPALHEWNLRNLRGATEYVYIALTGGNLAGMQRFHVAKDGLVPELQRIPGVSRVDVCGGEESRVVIATPPERMVALGITLRALEAVSIELMIRTDPDGWRRWLDREVVSGHKLGDTSTVRMESAPNPCEAYRGDTPVVVVRALVTNADAQERVVREAEAYEAKSPRGVHVHTYPARAFEKQARSIVRLRVLNSTVETRSRLAKKLRGASHGVEAMFVQDDGELEVRFDKPTLDTRSPDAYEDYLVQTMAGDVGCIFSERKPILRLRLLKNHEVLAEAKRLLPELERAKGVLHASIVSPSSPPSFEPERDRLSALSLTTDDVYRLLRFAREGIGGDVRLTMGKGPWQTAPVVLGPGKSVPLGELVREVDRSHLTALRVDRQAAADVCVVPSSSETPESIESSLTALAQAQGFRVRAERWSVR